VVGGGRVNRVRLLKVKAVDIHTGVPKPYVESRMLSLGLSVKLKHFSDMFTIVSVSNFRALAFSGNGCSSYLEKCGGSPTAVIRLFEEGLHPNLSSNVKNEKLMDSLDAKMKATKLDLHYVSRMVKFTCI